MKLVFLIGSIAVLRPGSAYFGWRSGINSDAISRDDAVALALNQTDAGDVKFARLPRADGKPAWQTEITQNGKPGMIEVRVNAMTGELFDVRCEFGTKADEELANIAKSAGITAAHLIPKVKQRRRSVQDVRPRSAENVAQPRESLSRLFQPH